MKTAVITGATSSIGTALIDECLKNRIKVIALVNPSSARRSVIKSHELLRTIDCSLADMKSLQVAREEEAVFFHLAWMNSKDSVSRDDTASQELNIAYSIDAVNLASRFGCIAFIGSGSQAEYGRTDEVLNETSPCNPDTAYGVAKLCAGQLTRLMCQRLGIRHIWARILSTYGPGGYAYSVVNYTITELISGRTPELSSCEQRWDFLYVSDTARALYLLGDRGHDGEVYVIGSGEHRVLKEYILQIRAAINPEAEVGFGVKKSSDIINLSCDISKIKAHTGFEPEVSFEDGIAYMIDYLKG